MKKLKGCAYKIGVVFITGALCCLLLLLAGIELGAYLLQFFIYIAVLAGIVSFMLFMLAMLGMWIIDGIQTGDAKEWWSAAKEGKTVNEKRSETRRKS